MAKMKGKGIKPKPMKTTGKPDDRSPPRTKDKGKRGKKDCR